MRSIERRVARLEAQDVAHGVPHHRHILIETGHLSVVEREQRIAEAEAEKQPGDLLIIVDRVRDVSYLEGYEDE